MAGLACVVALAAAGLTGTVGCKSDRTEVVVRVWGGPTIIERGHAVEVVLRGGSGDDPATYVETGREHFDLAVDRTMLPLDVAIVPADGDASRRFELVASVVDLNLATLTQTRVISGFVEGRTMQLDVWLSDGCLGVECPAGQSCFEDGACVDAHVDTSALHDFAPRPDTAPFDAGTDAGTFDAGPPMEREGGTPRPTCASTAECDDSNPCTDDACDAEHCTYRANTGSCDDGAGCTRDDACHEGECVGVAGCLVGLCNRLTGECECSPGAPGCHG